jgi:Tfp pilus assembly PilM family ATPase
VEQVTTVIEVTPSVIRSIVLQWDRDSFIISSVGEVELSGSEQEDITETLKVLRENNKIGDEQVITTYPLHKVLLRHIDLNPEDPQQMAKAFSFSDGSSFPINIEDVKIEIQTIRQLQQNSQRRLMCAVPRKALYDFTSVIRDAGLEPVYMGIAPNSHTWLLKQFGEDHYILSAVIELNEESSSFSLIDGGELLFTRSFSPGTNSLSASLKEKLSLEDHTALQFSDRIMKLQKLESLTSWPAAELKNYTLKKKDIPAIIDIFQSFADDIIQAVAMTLEQMERNLDRDLTVEHIYFSGLFSYSPFLHEEVEKHFSTPCSEIPYPSGYPLTSNGGKYASLLGTALAYRNDKKNMVNFLRGEFTPDYASKNHRIYFLPAFFIGIASVIMLLMLVATFFINSAISSSNESRLHEQFTKAFKVTDIKGNPVAQAEKIVKIAQRDYDKVKKSIKGDSIIDFFHVLTASLPAQSSIMWKNIIINDRVIRIDGSAKNVEDIEFVKNKLMRSNKFQSVTSNKRSRGNGMNFFIMTINKKPRGKQ